MPAALLPDRESERLRVLSTLQILDTADEEVFDSITALAARLCGCPVSLVSLVDCDRQWFKSAHGWGTRPRQTPREHAFCAHAIQEHGPLVVEDTRVHPTFADNPLVRGAPHIRFYAGQPLFLQGEAVGTLCVVDFQPRALLAEQVQLLQLLAQQVEALLERRRLEVEAERVQRRMLRERELCRGVLESLRGTRALLPSGVRGLQWNSSTFSGDLLRVEVGPDAVLRGLVGDVTGHGLAAALCHMPALDAYRRWVGACAPLEEVARDLNTRMRPLLSTGHFMAAVMVEYSPRAARLRVWNGGMPECWLFARGDRPAKAVPARHPALGVLGDADFDPSPFECDVDSGDLVVVTDGVEEAEDPGGRPFGVARLLEAAHGAASGAERAHGVERALRGHLGGQPPQDDVALLCLDFDQLRLGMVV